MSMVIVRFVFPSEGTFLDIGTPECYARAQQVWGGSEAVAWR